MKGFDPSTPEGVDPLHVHLVRIKQIKYPLKCELNVNICDLRKIARKEKAYAFS